MSKNSRQNLPLDSIINKIEVMNIEQWGRWAIYSIQMPTKSLIRWTSAEAVAGGRNINQHEEIKEPPLTSMLFKDALLLLAALSIWAAAYCTISIF